MASETILDLARQGDPKVIAALINRLVKPKGILARATKQNQCLHVLLESPHRLNQQATTTLIQQLIEQCQVATINQLTIYARQVGNQAIAWKQDVALYPAPASEHPEAAEGSVSDWDIDVSLDSTEAADLEPIAPPIDMSDDSNDDSRDSMDLSVEDDPDETESALYPTSTAIVEEPILPPNTDTEGDVVSHDSSDSDSSVLPSTEPPLEEDVQPIIDLEVFPPDTEDGQGWDMLKRPEAALLIVFALIVALWDIYLALIEEPASSHPLTGRELARRLGVDRSTISRRKDRLDFSEWTQDLDPEGLAWVYHNGVYRPQPNAEILVDL